MPTKGAGGIIEATFDRVELNLFHHEAAVQNAFPSDGEFFFQFEVERIKVEERRNEFESNQGRLLRIIKENEFRGLSFQSS